MKKNKTMNLFREIIDDDNLEDAYLKSLKGDNKHKIDAIKFQLDETYNLANLRQSLVDKTYTFDGYNEFKVYEPKERIINAPFYKDKIVQLAINNILKEVYNPTFIHDSYSCIDDKGTHRCSERIQYFIRKGKWEYGAESYIVKMDIEKFFYSIDRDILKKIIKKKIKCKDTLWLLFLIIDSANSIDSLGLPLGNTLSQIFANIYMNEADQYAKRKLRVKYYIRYADDIFMVVKNKNEANRIKELMTIYIVDNLELDIHKEKTKIFPLEQGVNAIGFKTYATHKLLRDDTKKKIKRKTKSFKTKLINDEITVGKVEQILNSWLGHAIHANSYNFILSLVERNDYIELEQTGDKTKLVVNSNLL